MDIDNRLSQIKLDLDNNREVPPVSVRELLGWFGVERRRYKVSYRIKQELIKNSLATKPDFDAVPLDVKINFHLLRNDEHYSNIDFITETETNNNVGEKAGAEAEKTSIKKDSQQYVVGAADEPAFRVTRLCAANQKPTTVKPNQLLREALTIMMLNDFSQLPVMTNDRSVKGIITLSSIMNRQHFSSHDSLDDLTVQDCMIDHVEVSETASLFSVIDKIVENSYVLVRSADNLISGIVTATDLSMQFRQLSEPFLLLAEIENHLRSLIDRRFTLVELEKAKNQNDDNRAILSVADLTLGEIVRLLEDNENWKKIGVPLDRPIIIEHLNKIRIIRNDVMHFDPDGITDEDHATLLAFVQFLHNICKLQKK
ncbi:CBS domain containing protein [Laribacter hongkongensis HLHK9]|uniref:CBS domain containing protein n=1 Tax=Laribacter hongkongensis (strain HLHK9) TaxID=557598 RepID=C1D852_LARHH|nr:CBS domain-containing protein [Laribacter hongkongensis]ACO74642.1 CBS domain containing protein [Laribacter hongkongensis HLHK9]